MRWASPFPPGIGFGVRRAGDPAEVLPEEESLLPARVAPRRRMAFGLGRSAAAAAMRDAGLARGPIGIGPDREPLWPEGLVGSISHAGDLGVAAVASRQVVRGIGVDIERLDRPVSDGVAERICLPSEREWAESAPDDRTRRLLCLFSAKEAIFKAFFPLERVFLVFADAHLVPIPGGFEARLRRQAARGYPSGCSVRVGSRASSSWVLSWLALDSPTA